MLLCARCVRCYYSLAARSFNARRATSVFLAISYQINLLKIFGSVIFILNLAVYAGHV